MCHFGFSDPTEQMSAVGEFSGCCPEPKPDKNPVRSRHFVTPPGVPLFGIGFWHHPTSHQLSGHWIPGLQRIARWHGIFNSKSSRNFDSCPALHVLMHVAAPSRLACQPLVHRRVTANLTDFFKPTPRLPLAHIIALHGPSAMFAVMVPEEKGGKATRSREWCHFLALLR